MGKDIPGIQRGNILLPRVPNENASFVPHLESHF